MTSKGPAASSPAQTNAASSAHGKVCAGQPRAGGHVKGPRKSETTRLFAGCSLLFATWGGERSPTGNPSVVGQFVLHGLRYAGTTPVLCVSRPGGNSEWATSGPRSPRATCGIRCGTTSGGHPRPTPSSRAHPCERTPGHILVRGPGRVTQGQPTHRLPWAPGQSRMALCVLRVVMGARGSGINLDSEGNRTEPACLCVKVAHPASRERPYRADIPGGLYPVGPPA